MPKWVRPVLPLFLGMVGAYAVGVILSAMWQTCDIGSNFARGWSLMVALPVTFTATVAATVVTFSLALRIPRKWAGYGAVTASVAVAVVVVVIAVAQTYSHESYVPSPSCPNGVPTWWWFPA